METIVKNAGKGACLIHSGNETLSKDRNCLVNPLTTYVPHHIETSQLICSANHLTGFCMTGIIGG